MDVRKSRASPSPLADSEEAWIDCQARLGYFFRQPALLRQALTHPSSTSDKRCDNERLEFVGDAILALVVCEYLYTHAPEKDEGALTEIKSVAVSRPTLAQAAQRLEIQRHLILGRGVGRPHGLPPSVYANAFEALVAAVYLDGGLEAARAFVMRHLRETIDEIAARGGGHNNYKAALQDWLQKRGLPSPRYEVMAVGGPEHHKVFTISVRVGEAIRGRGTGTSKKAAEQAAAHEALLALSRSEAAEAGGGKGNG